MTPPKKHTFDIRPERTSRASWQMVNFDSCKRGETAAKTGCTPESGEGGKKESEETPEIKEEEAKAEDGSWSGTPLNFPVIQGADVCGEVVDVGSNVNNSRIGERVLVRSMQENPSDKKEFSCLTLGSELNGGFAQYTAIRSSEVFSINSDC